MEEINRQIGLELRILREAHKYSLEDIGKRIGKSRKTIHAYEMGGGSMSVQTLASILSIYNVPIGRFLDNLKL